MKINTFIIGVPKSGTTTLYKALENNKDVALPIIKEPNFFCYEEMIKEMKMGITDAKIVERITPSHIGILKLELENKNYRNKKNIICDFSTSYCRYADKVAPRIKAYNPNAKIILIIRDPVKRIQSHYRMDLRIGYTKQDLNTLLKAEINGTGNSSYIKESDYLEIINTYKKFFDDILIIPFEQCFILDKYDLKDKLSEFLAISLDEVEILKENEAKDARFARLNYYLAKTGLKKIIKQTLSRRYKDVLKSLYFKKSESQKEIVFDKTVKCRLEELNDNYRRLIDDGKK
ncbi:sulfotransferase family protein [Alteromonas sp. RKMC-009]|uniref:sulfotransferase family protein n=1 Tax=Alteromonas sp. RKMC-009 TaxID=2267264 RepID=UPI00137552A6|nr:sulfotransferase [Alteromonas sp. RKMC-009]